MTTLRTRRFELREVITFAALAFAFGGGLGLVGVSVAMAVGALPAGSLSVARDIYIDILPTATLVIGFWFNAKRAE